MIEAACRTRELPIEATDFVKLLPTDSVPMVVLDKSGAVLYVKVSHPKPVGFKSSRSKDPQGKANLLMNQVLINEQIVHRLGLKMNAPVAKVSLVNVSTDFLTLNEIALKSAKDAMGHWPDFQPGICHGSHEIAGLTDRVGFDSRWESEADNPERLAKLAILYGLTGVKTDYQFFYKIAPPRRVFSLDHGFALGGFSNAYIDHWSLATLQQCVPAPTMLDSYIMTNCRPATALFRDGYRRLIALRDRDIAEAVATPPDTWQFGMKERIAVAKYLKKRRCALLLYLRKTL